MSADFEELRLQGRTIVKRYSQFLLGLRYIFFALSLIANLVYMIRYFKIRQKNRIDEQWQVLALGISLLFFNDPFFAVYILFPNEASSVFSVLVTSVFVAYLFSFWVAMIQQFNKARVPYLQLGLFIGLAVLTFSSMLAFHLQSLKDSFFEVDYSTALKVLFVLAVIAYILTTVLIFKLVADVCQSGQQILWRHKIFMMMAMIYTPLTVLVLANIGFSYYSVGKEVIIIIINYNLYVFLHLYLYSPTEQAGENEHEMAYIDAITEHNYLDLADLNPQEIEVSLSFVNSSPDELKIGEKEYPKMD